MKDNISARVWLRNNGYEDVADMIDDIMAEWKAAGLNTRRSWWDVMSGGENGRPRMIEGREFPVLRAAQKRQGKPVTKNAIHRKSKEPFSKAQPQNRWKNKKTRGSE